MPELPEVETICRDLSQLVVGRRIVAVDVAWPGSLRDTGSEFERRLTGAGFTNFSRRAKMLVATLDSGDRLLVHLKMSGRLVVVPKETPPHRHTRITFQLDTGEELRFIDMRKFGYIKLIPVGAPADIPEFARLGPEPLAPEFTLAAWIDLVSSRRSSRRSIKATLLDQSFLAGLGNIYVDEILYAAGIHPGRPMAGLAAPDIERIYPQIRRILSDAITARGTTFSQYVDGTGRSGGFVEKLHVYGRQGGECQHCQTEIAKTRVAGRGTHFCPGCQA